MSNKLSPESGLRDFLACLNTSLSSFDRERVFQLLEDRNYLVGAERVFRVLVDKGDILKDGTVRSSLQFSCIVNACRNKQISTIRELISFLAPPLELWSSLPVTEKERDLILALFDHDMPQVKTWLKVYQKQHSLKPDQIMRKLFGRHFSEELLKCLPRQVSTILARQEFQNCLFEETGFEIAAQWFLTRLDVQQEDKSVPAFIMNLPLDPEGSGARALRFWSQKNYREVCRVLDNIETLIIKRKVQKGKLSILLALVHILSRIQIANDKSVESLFRIYRSFFGESLLFGCLHILIDLNRGSIKKANNKLAGLSFHHKGSSGETFFLLLTRYWCQNKLSVKDLKTLGQLNQLYSDSGNLFMKYEIDALVSEAAGVDQNNLPFTHLPMARFLKGENKWEELLQFMSEDNSHEKRLIWLLRLQPGTEFKEAWADIEPAFQVKGKKEWKTPEMVSWIELLNPKNRDLLSSGDKRVISILRTATETHGVDYILPEGEALRRLSGVGNLYFADDHRQKITLEYVSPAVEVEEEAGSRYFSWKFPLTPGSLHIEEVDDFVFEICSLSEELKKLKDRTVKRIPVDDEKAFKEFLEVLPEELMVYSGGKIPDSLKSNISTDFKMIARFQPAGQEYKVSLLSTSHGLTSAPGIGRSVISVKKDGIINVWQRDKHEEGLLADAVAEAAGLDLGDCLSPYEWDVIDKQQLLNVLDSFAAQSQVELQWPRGGKINVTSASRGSFSVKPSKKRDWFQLEGKVHFDKKSIRLSDVIRKLDNDSRFVQISQNEFIALSKELRAGLTDLKRLSEDKHETLELHASLADTVSSRLKDIPGDLEQDFIFRDCVTRMIYGKTEEVKVPEGLRADLRSYQKKGYEWLASVTAKGVGACLADDMGLGKTLQTLALLLFKKERGPSLVIAPTSLCQNWLSEGKKFTPELNMIDYRGKDRDLLIKKAASGDVIVASYAVLNQDIDKLMDIYLNVLVLDEAQMVKNSGTLRSKSIKLLQAEAKVALSGTPVENHAGELWNLFDIINPGLLGTRSFFQKAYALPIEQYDPEAVQSLREKVKPFILRRTRKGVLKELPASQETDISVPMTEEERALYDAGRYQASKKLKKAFDKSRHKRERIKILAEITRLRTLAANFELSELFSGKSSKSKAVLDAVEELLDNGHKALIFSQFVKHLNIFEKYFQELNYSYTKLDGSMKQEHRKRAVDLFNNGKRDLMLISLKAGGFGLNLTAADFVIHLDPWWNPAVEDQAAGRALRIGQTKKVNILRFITESSIESEILKMHEHKRDISSDLLRGTATASKMSIDDLVKLLNS